MYCSRFIVKQLNAVHVYLMVRFHVLGWTAHTPEHRLCQMCHLFSHIDSFAVGLVFLLMIRDSNRYSFTKWVVHSIEECWSLLVNNLHKLSHDMAWYQPSQCAVLFIPPKKWFDLHWTSTRGYCPWSTHTHTTDRNQWNINLRALIRIQKNPETKYSRFGTQCCLRQSTHAQMKSMAF